MQFEDELACALPLDVPQREFLIEKAACHLAMTAAANEYMNLTRIIDPRDAVIKHVYDSVAPWKHFSRARTVLDVGTGAGFPGIPLSITLPSVRFTLTESTQKKARFVESVVESLRLPNVHVVSERAEERILSDRPDIITARAVAPMKRLLDLFSPALKKGTRLLLYKGLNVEADLAEVHTRALGAEVLCRYDLPRGLGSRTLLHIYASALAPKRVVS